MERTLEVFADGQKRYDIVIAEDFPALPGYLKALPLKGRKLCIVTDSNTEPLYGDTVAALSEEVAGEVCVYAIKAGERHKTLDTVRQLYEFLIKRRFDRKDMLLALGGGVVGDLTGFTAATYLRGISFIQVPTTLLAQVDSSIGGKTGVDFDAYKNMVGAFHMPVLVYINPGALSTLPPRQFASGMAEIIKHGLIKDAAYYRWLSDNRAAIEAGRPEVLSEMIEKSCMIKRDVVQRDPTEQGERALLNFGHTLGHAIEKASEFTQLHGECVALGCVAASFISKERGLISETEYEDIRETFRAYGAPYLVSGMGSDEIVALTRSDKKMDNGRVKFVLLDGVGKAFATRDVTDEEMRAALREIGWKDDKTV